MDIIELLETQNIDKPQSSVQEFLIVNNDCLRESIRGERVEYKTNDTDLLRILGSLKSWLELVYGYRESTKEGKLARGVASAGGMFPTVMYFLITHRDRYIFLSYFFERNFFYEIKLQDEILRNLSENIVQSKEAIQILVGSEVEKTVKRYGMRGYRYCLFDAGQVVANLVNSAASEIYLSETKDTLFHIQKELGINWLICILSYKIYNSQLNAGNEQQKPLTRLLYPVVNRHEHLESNIEQLRSIHGSAISFQQGLKLLPPFLRKYSIEKRIEIAEKRFSSSGFFKNYIDGNFLETILNKNMFDYGIYDTQLFKVYVVITRVLNEKSGVYEYDYLNNKLNVIEIIDEEELEFKLYLACARQKLVMESSLSIILACDIKCESFSSVSYMKHLLNFGIIDANMYLQATDYNIGSTCIGGFDDAKLMELIHDFNMRPLLMHIFGKDKNGRCKTDAIFLEVK